ncbi:response regulator [Labrys miyagiensis]|uniref:Response regulator n=1 Tax=Labrys miyagiensis TaxID=346912 RepID=A0ABQ6CPK0_9HYPH|nr:response regulator [Labrys miyagiensis]GLS20151.1 response regulator [Labrys miyagiensis]
MAEKATQAEHVVLLVEDEPIVRAVMVEFLSEQGVEVVEAENADKALEVLNRRSDIKLLFTDITMPGSMDGVALAREVHRRWPEMLLMLTSGGASVTRNEMPAASEFIPKPYDFDKLAERIYALMRKIPRSEN